jgi:hypothetical protein
MKKINLKILQILYIKSIKKGISLLAQKKNRKAEQSSAMFKWSEAERPIALAERRKSPVAAGNAGTFSKNEVLRDLQFFNVLKKYRKKIHQLNINIKTSRFYYLCTQQAGIFMSHVHCMV